MGNCPLLSLILMQISISFLKITHYILFMRNILITLFSLSTVLFAQSPVQKTVIEIITPVQAQELLKRKDAPQVIDVRTKKEFKKGHIASAQCIDVKAKDFSEKISKLDKTKPYIIHCRSGGRSTQSLKFWKEQGFSKIYHLDKGILSWQEAKLPLAK